MSPARQTPTAQPSRSVVGKLASTPSPASRRSVAQKHSPTNPSRFVGLTTSGELPRPLPFRFFVHQYFMFLRSSISPGPVGSQPSVLRVHSLDAGMSKPAYVPIQPK